MQLKPMPPAWQVAEHIRSGQLSPEELMEATLANIAAANPALNAFVTLQAEQAMDAAGKLAQQIAAGHDPGPLAGIPVGVKDLEDAAGMVTSYGSIPFKDNRVSRDSVQVGRLKAAGAIVVGKTNTPEFGYTGFTKNRLFGVTRNPWNLERTPGGSSGGSAAAVAAGLVPLATGSDGGGSIRIPASYSGCFGLKPSYGRIPLGPAPLLHMSHSWCPGPLSRTVRDAALYLDCVCGYHPADPDSLPAPPHSFVQCLDKPTAVWKIAFSPDLGYARVQQDVMAVVEKAVQAFEELGHRVELWPIKFPDVSDAWAKLMDCEIYAQLPGELEQIQPEMGRTLVKALRQAKDLGLQDLIASQRRRSELNLFLAKLFSSHDLLLTPTMPTEAFGAKGPPPAAIDGHPISLLQAVAFTYPFNLAGHPAASVRAGLTPAGLPVGLQIIGPRHRDDRVLQAAQAFEQARPWNDHWPVVSA